MNSFIGGALKRNNVSDYPPLWLVLEQVGVLTLNDGERLVTYAQEIIQQLRAEQVRVESDLGPDPIKARIAEAEKARVHTMLVIGGRDMDCRAGERAPEQQGIAGRGNPKAEAVAEISGSGSGVESLGCSAGDSCAASI